MSPEEINLPEIWQYGFIIQRRQVGTEEWKTFGFCVAKASADKFMKNPWPAGAPFEYEHRAIPNPQFKSPVTWEQE